MIDVTSISHNVCVLSPFNSNDGIVPCRYGAELCCEPSVRIQSNERDSACMSITIMADA